MKQITLLFIGLWLTLNSFAQQETTTASVENLEQRIETIDQTLKKLQKLKISGYLQADYQYGERDAIMSIGAPNENPEQSFNRIGIRRGRIKFLFEEGITSGVFQLDITEKGIRFKDAYLNIKDPWKGGNALRAGIFDRPFGYEISYSSRHRESPERSRVFQTLFPNERDLGGMIILQASKNSAWNFLKLQGGLFAGNGIALETDNKRDFIGHLSLNKRFSPTISLGGGVSHYNGKVYQGTENVFTMSKGGFVKNSDPANQGKFAHRIYYGVDGQIEITSILGSTKLNAEYLFGTQPGGKTSTGSPNASTLPTTDTYIRDFKGGYAMLVQDLGKLPFSVVLKYDFYNPNTDISSHEIGLNDTGKGDVTYTTYGAGLIWKVRTSIRIQTYYEMIHNEISQNLKGFETDRPDNLLTVRVQCTF